jgi:hypothetical protein
MAVTITNIVNGFINVPGYFLARIGNVEATCLMTTKEGQMRTNAGLYGPEEELKNFRNLYSRALFASDAFLRVYTCPSFRICDELLVRLGIWRPTIPYFEYAEFYLQMMETLTTGGKKVCIVSHFDEEFAEQLPLLNKIWPKHNIKTENVVFVHAHNTVYERPHSGYTETLVKLTQECLDTGASHYFLSCGAYGLPLGAALANQKRNSIYVGGILQTVFGIMGKRWDDRPEVVRNMNLYWRYADATKYKALAGVEGGCYL